MTRAILMGIDNRECFNLMKQNPDGSEDVDVDMLRDIVLASRKTGDSVWIHNERISSVDMSSKPSTDGPEETSKANRETE